MVRGCWHHWNVLVQGCRRRGDAMGMCCCRGCRHHRDAMGMHRCRDAGTTGMQWGCIAAGDAAPWQCLALLLLQDPQDPPPRSQLVAALHFLHARSGLQQQQQQQRSHALRSLLLEQHVGLCTHPTHNQPPLCTGEGGQWWGCARGGGGGLPPCSPRRSGGSAGRPALLSAPPRPGEPQRRSPSQEAVGGRAAATAAGPGG